MSIATRTGDDGTTGLLYGHRVLKTHPIVDAVGDLDEASAAIGVAKQALRQESATVFGYAIDSCREPVLDGIQRSLWDVMGEINCTSSGELYDYSEAHGITDAILAHLDEEIKRLEASTPPQKGWVLYGSGSAAAAALDMASKVMRRAERSYLRTHQIWHRPLIGKYINRLSDLLYLMARAS